MKNSKRQVNIRLRINNETIKEIEDTYGKSDYFTISTVVSDIIYRYMGVEYFDPEIICNEEENYAICNNCSEKAVRVRRCESMIGNNKLDVCENCGYQKQ